MSKPILMLAVVLLPAILLCASCSFSGGYGGVKTTQETAIVATEVEVSPDRVSAGERATVRITVKNLSSPQLTLMFPNQQKYGYMVVDADGNVIDEFPLIYQPAGSRLVIEAHGEVVREIEYRTNGLEPGSYTVWGGLLKDEDEFPWAAAVFEVTN